MKPLLTKEDYPIETPPPKMNAVLLTFFLRLSSYVMKLFQSDFVKP